MSWPSNAVNGGILLQHDWLVDEWPWDPLTLAIEPLGLDPLVGARNNNDAPALPAGAPSAPALPAETPGGGSGSGGGGTLKRRSGSRQAIGPDARGATNKQARGSAALVCRIPGCGVAVDSLSAYCKRTR
jgi:hypothetical protein